VGGVHLLWAFRGGGGGGGGGGGWQLMEFDGASVSERPYCFQIILRLMLLIKER